MSYRSDTMQLNHRGWFYHISAYLGKTIGSKSNPCRNLCQKKLGSNLIYRGQSYSINSQFIETVETGAIGSYRGVPHKIYSSLSHTAGNSPVILKYRGVLYLRA